MQNVFLKVGVGIESCLGNTCFRVYENCTLGSRFCHTVGLGINKCKMAIGWMRTELGPLFRAFHVIPDNFYYNPSFSSRRKVVPWEQEFSPEQSSLLASDIKQRRKEAIGASCPLEKERPSSPGKEVPLLLLWSCTQYNAWQLSTHQ